MKIQIIKSPSPGVMAMLARRRTRQHEDYPGCPGAIGLVQGSLADMITAADLAEKAAQVKVEEIRGLCPQHITLIAIYGDIAAVEYALKVIAERFQVSLDRTGSGNMV